MVMVYNFYTLLNAESWLLYCLNEHNRYLILSQLTVDKYFNLNKQRCSKYYYNINVISYCMKINYVQ